MTKEEWIKIYNAKDGTWDKDDLIDKAYEIITSPIRTNYDRIKQMSIDEMARDLSDYVRCSNCFAEELCNELDNSDSDKLFTMKCEQKFKMWLESEAES